MANNIHQVKMPDVEKYTLHTNIRKTPNNVDNVSVDKINDLNTILNRTRATIATGYVKAGAGLMDIMELIGDGELWAIGKVFDGNINCLAQSIGLINPDAESAILDLKSRVDDWIIDDISFDITNTLEDEVFNSNLGSRINDASYMKRESVAANRIEGTTKFGGEVALATAATVASGGAASPVLFGMLGLGAAEGAGEKANKLYQQSTGTSTAKEASIFFSGLSGAAKWYAYGRLGKGILDVSGGITNTIAEGPYTKKFGASKSVFEAFNKLYNSGEALTPEILKNAINRAFTEPENIVDVFNGVTSELSSSLEKGLSVKETTGRVLVDGVIQNIILNTGVERVQIFGDSMKAVKHFVPTLDKKVLSITKDIIKTADAAEDSGVVDFSLYDTLDKMAN